MRLWLRTGPRSTIEFSPFRIAPSVVLTDASPISDMRAAPWSHHREVPQPRGHESARSPPYRLWISI